MNFLEFLKAVIFGIVEGITEWLPISSTGHMILLEELIPLNVSREFWDMFLVVIQLGAILAVCVLFFNKLNPFAYNKDADKNTVVHIFGNNVHVPYWLASHTNKRTWLLWARVIVGCIPAGVIGVLFNNWFEENFNNSGVVAATLIIYGILFILIEIWNKKRKPVIKNVGELSYTGAFTIGLIQVLSLIPGTSRSGVTIIGSMALGVSRTAAAEFSFFMSIPIMFGASLLKLIKFGFNYTASEVVILITGMVVAFAVSIVSIRFLMDYIKKHNFKIFGIYRIILGIIVIIFFALR